MSEAQATVVGRRAGLAVGLALLGMKRSLTVSRHQRELAEIDRMIATAKAKLGPGDA